MEFNKGEIIQLEGGKSAKIVSKLGEGGQGIVYAVKIDGKDYALKWYTFRFQNKKAFRKNLQDNIASGAPDEKFLWPLYLTEEKSESFGYVMHLRPNNFADFSDILNNKVRFSSTETLITSALNIVNAFRTLHRKGLSYQDLNDGNFFIDVKTGDVLICDNDNVTPDGMKNAGNIGGKPGYMAPEIVVGKSHPNSLTDNHSLAVIIFKLLCRHDPLMGKAYVDSVCITERREYELYGEKPVFIFNPNDASNRPVAGVHPNPIKLWPRYPKFLQDAFIQSFCGGLKDPNKRLPDNEWQKLLLRFRSVLLKCPHCSSELCLVNHQRSEILKFDCGSTYSYPLALEINKHKIPLFPGAKLYACFTSKSSDDYITMTGEVIMNKNNPSFWGIKNLSDKEWSFATKSGEIKKIENGSVIPITKDLEITFDGLTAKVLK
ncbi:MAG: serine/threonine protein kinase [Treponema sp.]|nr:serine/threonine protein kinase [Treponema sp.]